MITSTTGVEFNCTAATQGSHHFIMSFNKPAA